MQHTILLVDDDPVQRRLMEAATIKAGYDVLKAASGEEALEILKAKSEDISAVILDLVMPGIDGMDVLKRAETFKSTPPMIVQTAQGGIETVVGAMREGAFDFVVKPVAPNRLLSAIEKAVKFERVQYKQSTPRQSTKSGFGFEDIITRSDSMAPIIAMGRKAAASTIPVLIEGESGVGKELIARAIHGSSERRDKPLVIVNCGALPENIVESILFGHEKGAFTGASDKHIGKFVEADGGTLFLDEIGELPLELQVKMLRAIQEGEIDPVGAKKSVKVDVRLVSATNRNLLEEVKKGRFREDLFYRLNVLPMTIPPLRKRKSDIEALVFHFVKKISKEERKTGINAIRPEVMAGLTAYDWPGNIRELENSIFRAIVLCDGEELTMDEFPQIASQLPDFKLDDPDQADPLVTISTDMLPDMLTPANPSLQIEPEETAIKDQTLTFDRSKARDSSQYGMISLISSEGEAKKLEDVEGEVIRFAMEIYNGRMSEIARRLGIGRSTLYRKMKEHEIEESK